MTTTAGPGAGRLARLASLVTYPLTPSDLLGVLVPLEGGRGLRARVEQVLPEAAGAVTLVLRPGRGWQGHTAGQWLRVGVEIDGVLHRRSYSITTPPADGLVRITVKPVADGFVSHALARVAVGTLLRLDQAAGDFVLPPRLTGPVLFVTGGSGVTPVMGMLRSLALQGPLPDVVLVHSALTRDDVIFGDELRRLAAEHPRFRLVERHTDVDGLLTLDRLADLVPDWADRETWACGPAGLLDALEQHWADADLAERLHTERFAPKVVVGDDAEGGRLVVGDVETEAPGATPLLDAGEAAGVLLPSGCRMGICYGCVVPLLRGQVRDLRTGEVHGEPGDLVQTCVSAAAGTVELD
ncbi:MAG: Ferredoxin-NADP reductase, partial [Frankiales bacterium]|nr:Ferredoxin-NADP reductase [Frankiales bacterium]